MVNKMETLREVAVLLNCPAQGVTYRKAPVPELMYQVDIIGWKGSAVVHSPGEEGIALTAQGPTLDAACDALGEKMLELLTTQRDEAMTKWGRAMELLGKKP